MKLRVQILLFVGCLCLIPLAYFGSVVWTKHQVADNVRAYLEAAKSSGQYPLIHVANVSAEYDDGCVCSGHADLTFLADHKPQQVSAVFTVARGGRPSQICALQHSSTSEELIQELERWNERECWGR